jgi:endonuclease YncB( thermonuclease family)
MTLAALQKRSANGASSYLALRNAVRKTLILGRQRIEREKVYTYWETGKLIKQHLLAHKDRADYGKQVISRLSEDLNISQANLWRSIQFYEKFPILAGRREWGLNWTHYKQLIAVKDEEKRAELMSRAERSSWTADELMNKIKKELWEDEEASKPARSGGDSDEPLKPKLGKLYTYRIVEPEDIGPGKGALFIDQGFATYRYLADRKNFKAGDIVRSEIDQRATTRVPRLTRLAEREARDDLFTYRAYVERVIDGDTLRVKLDLGFDEWTRQYLRLRGLDCPEIARADGRRALEFVQSRLKSAPHILVASTRSDKYDRYLADIFIPKKRDASHPNEYDFLNNELLQQKLAVRSGRL